MGDDKKPFTVFVLVLILVSQFAITDICPQILLQKNFILSVNFGAKSHVKCVYTTCLSVKLIKFSYFPCY